MYPSICIEIIHPIKPHDQSEDLGAGIITRYNEKLNYVAT